MGVVGGSFSPAELDLQDISVSGIVTADSLVAKTASIDGAVTIDTLNVESNTDIVGNLVIGGSFSPAELDLQDISVSGTVTADSLVATTASIDGAVTIDTLNVESNADIGGDLVV